MRKVWGGFRPSSFVSFCDRVNKSNKGVIVSIVEWLEKEGVNRSELARRAGVSRSSVHRLITGRYKSVKLMERVSAVTGGAVTVAELVGIPRHPDFLPE